MIYPTNVRAEKWLKSKNILWNSTTVQKESWELLLIQSKVTKYDHGKIPSLVTERLIRYDGRARRTGQLPDQASAGLGPESNTSPETSAQLTAAPAIRLTENWAILWSKQTIKGRWFRCLVEKIQSTLHYGLNNPEEESSQKVNSYTMALRK